ncbi:isoleucine-tRNA ligase [Ophidiomyces ophidiicola]|uniref:isoleucine-tRNA ligase n=1 Tax=Ophidiomyces ophidiicola TaxID=1387563 RepID=UPI0020C20A4E|nr:isoleucine-tRNA ligase [Ophidiomyces ophidiicola]KAI1947522.1 isoleucine-tRNA ligase [Ophidiomyces ophidiicola]KAI2049389.1 isoleucine-tRNA ligase [Ophidiomyces ophidiicola]
MSILSMDVFPGQGLGWLTLGASLHNTLTRLKAAPQSYPTINLVYNPSDPIHSPIEVRLPENGIQLRFDGLDQRLRLIEVLDFTKTTFLYKGREVFKGGHQDAAENTGPKFRHIYNRLFGLTFPGEYIPPESSEEVHGTYILSYPGVSFAFPLIHSPRPADYDFVSKMLPSNSILAASMAIFLGDSWADARSNLFTRLPIYPRLTALTGKNKEHLAEEVDFVNVHGGGRIEIIRKGSLPFWITLSETSPQDLIAELGPPDAIYRKNDRRILIHGGRSPGDSTNTDISPPRSENHMEPPYLDHTPDNSAIEDSDDSTSSHDHDNSLSGECFYNYFNHGFDLYISHPTTPSPSFPGSTTSKTPAIIPSSHLTVTKVILHGNVPGSHTFNRHRRSRWALLMDGNMFLNSETHYKTISPKLKEIWKGFYSNTSEENAFQRGMVLNRGWGDSPGSSIELLGGWEENSKQCQQAATGDIDSLGNTELFGFPGLLFEVLKNGASLAAVINAIAGESMPDLSRSLARSWSSTLKLPKSTFPARIAAAEQAKYLRRCSDDLYSWQRRHRPNNHSQFIFHDGPPYANGDLHVGHALNKILKDIICRVQVAQGKRVEYIPGWDCHGLPIELKALNSRKELGNNASPAMVRTVARQLAEETVAKQMQGFQEWGVMGDWGMHWKTMDKEFEMRQLEVFLDMMDKGLIYRRYKPVYWSPSTSTALAEAELEYRDDHVSHAALVKYPLAAMPAKIIEHSLVAGDEISAVIWTTTPWTLPANAAIAVHKDLRYAIVQSTKHGKLLIAESRREYVEGLLEDKLDVLVTIPGAQLLSKTTYRPHFKDKGAGFQPVISANFVTDESGSGLVHCAPGHGMEDYEVCLKHGIPAFAPVDGEGRFTDAAVPSNPSLLSGKSVLAEGNKTVISHLEEKGWLLRKHRYRHKYPYDWRSKMPVIIRATEQWFADVGDIRKQAVGALQNVRFFPSSGKARLEAFVKNRTEWCISRQRAWGVPIPALYQRETGEAVLTRESVTHIMDVIKQRGIDAWWTDDENDIMWIPPSLRDPASLGFTRGKDTMDVWFDSGTSWSQMKQEGGTVTPSADIFLEGTDQHRGWFQSSLLTFVAHQLSKNPNGPIKAPFKTLVTHGFTLDHAGRKMSKSIGNIIHPHEIMNGTLLPPLKIKKPKGVKGKITTPLYDALGPDALRLWVAGSDYTKDVVIGPQILKATNGSLHKYRVTFKLILGALQDFDPKYQVPYESLRATDKIALSQLRSLVLTCQEAFKNLEFFKAITALNRWANADFSAFYIESIKDRLYADQVDGQSRRAAQTTLFHIYTHIQSILGPVVPLLVEESWEHTPKAIQSFIEHPHHRITASPRSEWENSYLERGYPALAAANSAVKMLQETARIKKEMGSSLQSFVHLEVPDSASIFQELGTLELADFLVVSSVTTGCKGNKPPAGMNTAEWSYETEFELPNGEMGKVWIYAPVQNKCERCWKYLVPTDKSQVDSLCQRCESVVSDLAEPESEASGVSQTIGSNSA